MEEYPREIHEKILDGVADKIFGGTSIHTPCETLGGIGESFNPFIKGIPGDEEGEISTSYFTLWERLINCWSRIQKMCHMGDGVKNR